MPKQIDISPLSIKQNMLWNTIGSLFFQGCLWLVTVLVVILAGYDDSGMLAYAMAIGNIYFPLATYNMRTVQVSDIDDEYSQSNYVAFRLITIVAATFLILIYLGITTSSFILFIVSTCWILFRADESFSNVYYGVEQKHMRMDYIGKSQLLRGILVLTIFTTVLSLTKSIPASLLIMTVASSMITIFYDRRKAASLSSITPRINLQQVKELLKTCLPSTMTIVIFGSVVTIVRQIYEGIYGTESLGIYAAIATPTVLINALTIYLYNPYLGPIAKAWKQQDMHSIILTMRKVLGIIAILVVLFSAVCALWGTQLLSMIYGTSIIPYTYLLIPTVFTIACTASMAFLADVMIAFRKYRIALTSNLISLILALIISLPIMQTLGMNGINITIIIAYLAGVAICIIMFALSIRRHDQRRP